MSFPPIQLKSMYWFWADGYEKKNGAKSSNPEINECVKRKNAATVLFLAKDSNHIVSINNLYFNRQEKK